MVRRRDGRRTAGEARGAGGAAGEARRRRGPPALRLGQVGQFFFFFFLFFCKKNFHPDFFILDVNFFYLKFFVLNEK